MMRAIFFATLFASSYAFSPAFIPRGTTTKPFMTAETHIDKSFTSGSGMNEHDIPLLIKNLSKDNFDESLEMLEPLLTNECVGDICDDYMSQLKDKAEEIGMKVPEGYAPSHH